MPDNSKEFDNRFFGMKDDQANFEVGKDMLRRKYLANALDEPTMGDLLRGGDDQPTEAAELREYQSMMKRRGDAVINTLHPDDFMRTKDDMRRGFIEDGA